MKGLNVTALVLIIVGAINWLLVGIADFNLVAAIFGVDTFLSNLIYIVVGLAGLYCLALLPVVTRVRTKHREATA